MKDANEYVVLLNDALEPIGHADKATVHTHDTPLHLAFSCYIKNGRGELLVTRRSLSKIAWPGVWTNSACGHPMPGESFDAAIRRRIKFELGLELERIDMLLEHFQYCERDASGIVEHEFCPVFLAVTNSEPDVNPDEVMDYKWAEPVDIQSAVKLTPWAYSPWMVQQLALIKSL
ncbi:isopentenyl-diphosphate Delta-isomerase [Vibrio sp.]|uniref:Isopentenyl-diphosphate Delta-isomerase n=1 Tax=Vibrio viridaestus TaxID=2487322 RepID=A0A3N9TKJ5_9VIBR|nr:isopentenyl-diphosphate Delta-isomerase [Vibrio viridaestus]MDC0611879.1 isopentenyl-diphosphate Delta-isomerase [Vibrio sp.]RQW64869.1 isopentenyl-diphosphate Delta-isomerase [Vibrio viridaestus]